MNEISLLRLTKYIWEVGFHSLRKEERTLTVTQVHNRKVLCFHRRSIADT